VHLIKGTIKKKSLGHKCVFLLSIQLLPETYLILKRIQDNVVINDNDLRVKHPLFLSHFNETWIFSAGFRKTLKFHENPSSGSQVVPCGQYKRQYSENGNRSIII